MNIHFYYSLVPNSGDIRRIKNIDLEISDFYKEPSVEVLFYGFGERKKIKSNGKFKVGGEKNKKLYIFQPPKANMLFPIYQALVLALLGIIYRPQVIVGEMFFPYKFRKIFRFFNPHTTIIADIHGARVEELTYINPAVDNERLKLYETQEKTTIETADVIICQSDEMKNYIAAKYVCNTDKIIVYRCGYDTSSFYINKDWRRETRHNLKVKQNETLFVYSGGLHRWQKMEESLLVFKNYLKTNNDAKLLVLTGDQNTLKEMLNHSDFKELIPYIISFSVPFEQVSRYLNAADIAFLIRDNHPMNAVASPTKLAEYMACGLPIITSEVARYWVTDEALPYLVFSESADIEIRIKNALGIKKEYISNYAMSHLSLNIDKANMKETLAKLFV